MSYYTTIQFKITVKPEHRQDMQYVAGRQWAKVTDTVLSAFRAEAENYARWGEIPFGGKWDEQAGIWEVKGDYNKFSPIFEEYLLGLIAVLASNVYYYRRMEEDGQPWTYYKFDYRGNVYLAPTKELELKAQLKPEYIESFRIFLDSGYWEYDYWDYDSDSGFSSELPFERFLKEHQLVFQSEFSGNSLQGGTLVLKFTIHDEDFYIEDLLDELVLPAAARIDYCRIKKTDMEEVYAETDFYFKRRQKELLERARDEE
ncbi:MAG: hypothetical protein ACI4KM_00320 [Oscillospiraceae bacterium]